MKQARALQETSSGNVVFLDFDGKVFDAPALLTPVDIDRDFWTRTLKVALDELAALVAPRMVVMCEGQPATVDSPKAEFDASCCREHFPARSTLTLTSCRLAMRMPCGRTN